MRKGVSIIQQMHLAASRYGFIEVPLLELRPREQDQCHRVRRIERRSFVQQARCRRKIAGGDVQSAQVQIGEREVVVKTDRVLQRLALSRPVPSHAYSTPKLLYAPA